LVIEVIKDYDEFELNSGDYLSWIAGLPSKEHHIFTTNTFLLILFFLLPGLLQLLPGSSKFKMGKMWGESSPSPLSCPPVALSSLLKSLREEKLLFETFLYFLLYFRPVSPAARHPCAVSLLLCL
jgi:hypothetical protein